jgi:hypothetical protein
MAAAPPTLAAGRALRDAARDGPTVEVRANHGARRSAADHVTLAGKDRIGRVHRAARGTKPFGQAACRWQAIARPQLTGSDRGPDVLVDLTINWNGVVARERKAPQALVR